MEIGRRSKFIMRQFSDHGPIRVVLFQAEGYYSDLAEILRQDGYELVDADPKYGIYYYGSKQWKGLRASIVRKSILKVGEDIEREYTN